jgi:ubiquitin
MKSKAKKKYILCALSSAKSQFGGSPLAGKMCIFFSCGVLNIRMET